MARRIPTRGLIIAIIIVFIAVYLSTIVESTILRFAVLFIAFFFVASAFMGLFYEDKIAKQIIQAGYIDDYIKNHGVGTQKTFKQLIAQLKRDGYNINPGVEKTLWEEIKERTGYHQNSV
jgi:hypothetical protein